MKHLGHLKDSYEFSFVYCFFNLHSDCVFTSQKVGTRSLYRLEEEFGKAKRIYDLEDFYKLHALVRNPYRRLESLYQDKLLVSVQRGFFCYANNTFGLVQRNQQEAMKIFGEQRVRQTEIGFEEFVVDGMPRLINTESHFFPQTRFIPDFVTDYYHLENEQEVKFIFSLFNHEPIHVHRSSEFVENKLVWTDEMKAVAFRLYQRDFERFGYEA